MSAVPVNEAAIREELAFQLDQVALSQLASFDFNDRDAYLYNVGVEDGLRAMAVALLKDKTLLRNNL